jgi:ketosteroid isomerase-like protein
VQTAHENPNVALLKRGYKSFAAGDVPAALKLLDDGIVFHIPGDNLLAGDHTGKPAVGEAFRRFEEMSGGTFKLQPREIFANDDYGTVLSETTAARNGRTLTEQPVQVWRFEDGTPVELWLYPRNQNAFDEFWS